MAIYAIGDVQGCFVELQLLLEKINFQPAIDTLWFVGDLVNRGPDSLAVLRFVKSLPNKIVVLGNHDFHLLALYYECAPAGIKNNLQEVLEAPDSEQLLTWLRHQPLMHWDNKLNFVLVHAGIYPAWSLTEALGYAHEVEQILQSEGYRELLANIYGNEPAKWSGELRGFARYKFIIDAFVRMRLCNTALELEFAHKGRICEAPFGFMPWYKIPERKTKAERIIFGHWAALEGKVEKPNLYPLDTGCVWGNSLTAFRLDDRALFKWAVKC